MPLIDLRLKRCLRISLGSSDKVDSQQVLSIFPFEGDELARAATRKRLVRRKLAPIPSVESRSIQKIGEGQIGITVHLKEGECAATAAGDFLEQFEGRAPHL